MATYQAEQWEPMLRFSSIGKADMELCLPVPPQRERAVPADSAGDRKHVSMCGCSRNVFAPSVHVTWNVAGNGCVCLCSARVAMPDEQARERTHTAWKAIGTLSFLTRGIMIQNAPQPQAGASPCGNTYNNRRAVTQL